jgi:hypothetical protein
MPEMSDAEFVNGAVAAIAAMRESLNHLEAAIWAHLEPRIARQPARREHRKGAALTPVKGGDGA